MENDVVSDNHDGDLPEWMKQGLDERMARMMEASAIVNEAVHGVVSHTNLMTGEMAYCGPIDCGMVEVELPDRTSWEEPTPELMAIMDSVRKSRYWLTEQLEER